MSKNLVIVESPAKAKTIEKILGSSFKVKSSFGHVRDLVKGKGAIDLTQGYQPKYEISEDKHKVIKELKQLVKSGMEVWLATDEDREGEAISWHLAEALGLDLKTTKRIVFREITPTALKKAVQQPRLVDLDLVNAQQARRILDRLVGFELSELLWHKVKGKLSAGRVQSVAVRLVCEREREILDFESQVFYRSDAYFWSEQQAKQKFQAELSQRFDNKDQGQAFLEACKTAEFKVRNIEVKPAVRRPAAPFTTSTLQQEASRKLGFSVSRTMSVAQSLYEMGYITYMRTDSTNLSETALKELSEVIEANYGKNYVETRQYTTKKKGAQEAHEAIRPTQAARASIQGQRDEMRLYELIWKRTLASQMADAKLERTLVEIAISNRQEFFKTTGEVLKFDGFLKLYLESQDDEEEEGEEGEKRLPILKIGETLGVGLIQVKQRFTRPTARFTEASLVKRLEELGIGRPSTYAPTISRIMDPSRGYVTKENRDGEERPYTILSLERSLSPLTIKEKQAKERVGQEKNKLFATDLGMIVTDFLKEHFEQIMDYSFTAKIEERLDEVAEGSTAWVEVLDEVYKPFHELVVATEQVAGRATGERILGKDPKTGRTVLTRMGRYGALVQLGTSEELGQDEKPSYANLPKEIALESLQLDQALALLHNQAKTYPDYLGAAVSVGSGRYGPFVKWGESYISLPKDPSELSFQELCFYIDRKRQEDQPLGHYLDLPITKGKGRFGPFVKWNGKFVSITKGSGFDFDTITQAQAIELIEAKEEKERTRYIANWPEKQLSIEQGRWGPFIRYGKKNFKLISNSGNKLSPEEAANLSYEEVWAMVEAQGGKALPEKTTKTKTKKAEDEKPKTTKKGKKS